MRSRVTASAMDVDGNTYVTGWRVVWEQGSQYVSDLVTIKYNKFGEVQWMHRYPDDPRIDGVSGSEGWGIAVDRLGNAYVAGHSGTGGNSDCVLIKYSASYQQGDAPEWVRTFAGEAARSDHFWNLTLDPDGFIYVTGYTFQSHDVGTNGDFLTMKFDGNGTMVWAEPAVYSGPRGEQAFAVAVDPIRKNVFVTGFSDTGVLLGPTGTAMGTDLVTIMYNDAGVEQWVRRFNGKANGISRGTSLQVDTEGSVYVTGWVQGQTSLDIATVKYGMDGTEKWASVYDGPAAANDQPAPPVGWGAGAVGSVGSYIQTNQGLIVADEILDPIPAVDYLMSKVLALDLHKGLQTSLLAKLKFCLKSLQTGNAAVRRNAHHGLEAFVHEVEALRKAGLLTDAVAQELSAVAMSIAKSIQGIPTTVVYVAGDSAGDGTGLDLVLLKYNAEDGSPMWNLPSQPGTSADKPGNPANIALRHHIRPFDRVWGMAMDRDGAVYLACQSLAAPPTAPALPDYETVLFKYAVNTYRPQMLAEASFKGELAGLTVLFAFATFRDPDTNRQYIFRDPVTNEDFVGIAGNAPMDTTGNPLGQFQYTTLMYNGYLEERWMQTHPVEPLP
ncbi:MAG: SBBP repeat-containing protein [Bryobacterales bacterium]|nr:SBBP repeat-containing protein [Bryobacterales bacterium]